MPSFALKNKFLLAVEIRKAVPVSLQDRNLLKLLKQDI